MVSRAVISFVLANIFVQLIDCTGLDTLREVKFFGGKAGASSTYSLLNSHPNKAFLEGSTSIWHSGKSADGTGIYRYSFPHIIWYQFPKAFIPARVSFKARPTANKGCGGHGCAATKYQIVATNDPKCNRYSKWTVLCEDLSGEPIKYVDSQSKYCTVDVKMREPFSCVGISVLDSTYTGTSAVSMNSIRMWARELIKGKIIQD